MSSNPMAMAAPSPQSTPAPRARPTRPTECLRGCFFSAFCIAASPVALAQDAASIADIGGAIPQAINPAGNVIVGIDRGGAHRWTATTGFVRLGLGELAQGYSWIIPMGVSADGDAVIGAAYDKRGSLSDGFIWSGKTGRWQSLGNLNGGRLTVPRAINHAGNVVVGEAEDGKDPLKRAAFRWTPGHGIEALGYLNGGWLSQATAVNATGDVIVGDANDGPGRDVPRVAFRWTRAGGIESLGSLHGPNGNSRAKAVNAVGDVVAGYSEQADGRMLLAFRWTRESGMRSLGTINGGAQSWANGIDASGDVIVGSANDGSAAAGGALRAFRWTREKGMQTVEQWLADAGVRIVSGLRTHGAAAVNGDGSVVIGRLSNGHGFIARVPPAQSPSTPGLVVVDEYAASLYALGRESKLPLQEQRMVLHGAHGTPLQHLLAAHEQFLRANGDVGQTGGSGARLRRLSGEIGWGYGLTPALQIQLALGRTHSNQELPWNGSARHGGTYLLPELIWQARRDMFLSASGYYNSGRTEVSRGYGDTGSANMSHGSAHTTTTSLRLRIDLRNAARLGRVDLSPYSSLTWSSMKMGAYRESGGSFPAQFHARSMQDQILRLGSALNLSIGAQSRIDGIAEVGYRLNNMPRIAASGNIIGLGSFSIDEADRERRFWPRIGAGFTTSAPGLGKLSAMFNATKREGNVGYWLASAYSARF